VTRFDLAGNHAQNRHWFSVLTRKYQHRCLIREERSPPPPPPPPPPLPPPLPPCTPLSPMFACTVKRATIAGVALWTRYKTNTTMIACACQIINSPGKIPPTNDVCMAQVGKEVESEGMYITRSHRASVIIYHSYPTRQLRDESDTCNTHTYLHTHTHIHTHLPWELVGT
jgi:hypothetical protein